VLDVGCGVGGTSIRLASLLGAQCTGISLSPKQVEMATANAEAGGVSDLARFFQGDGEALLAHPQLQGLEGTFDAVWISEALSHFPHKERFFSAAAVFLRPGGRLVMCDWFKAENLGPKMTGKGGVIDQIEIGMLLPPMKTPSEYVNYAVAVGLRPIFYEDVSKETARTWDICLELIANPALWAMATTMGRDFVAFLHSFLAMKDGFATGAFRFSLLVNEKPTAEQTA
jgi:tocopherol O-methyltransferase